MKIRQGFVSNSSSSSFVVFGLKLDVGKINELNIRREDEARKGWQKPSNHGEDCECSKCTPPEVDDFDIYEAAEKAGLECDEDHVGLSPNDMKDDETKAQFKERIAKMISDAFYPVDAKKIRYIEESFYDS